MTATVESCWIGTAPPTRFTSVTRSGEADVVVIGAGIVGLTTAYTLARDGISVVVLEAGRIARGATARSTAKVTCQHGLALSTIAKRHGEARARLYAQANAAGAAWIAVAAQDLRIECDLEQKDAYAYASSRKSMPALDREARIARKVGLPAKTLARAPLPFAHAGAVVLPGQAQFNPAKFLVGLAKAVHAAGGRIHEHARVAKADLRQGSIHVARHRIRAQHIVMACHLPIASPIPFDQITQPRCHIVMAFRAPERAIDGMFIGVDEPSHSLRMGRDSGGPLLIALAPQFPTGHEGNVALRFEALERWVRASVPEVGETRWRWVNEDYDSPDDVPYAGRLAKKAKRLYVATGFGGWGISNGVAAGLLIADQIRGRNNPWSRLYAPERRARKANSGGDTHTPLRDVDELPRGEGGVITRGKRKIAVWKGGDGRLRAFSAECTHKGCTVTFCNADRTWQCPCHGSVFAADGSVLHGPATEPLKPVVFRR